MHIRSASMTGQLIFGLDQVRPNLLWINNCMVLSALPTSFWKYASRKASKFLDNLCSPNVHFQKDVDLLVVRVGRK